MYLRHTTRRKDGKVHRYWRLVRSVRVGRKVVQQTVAQLGELDAQGRARAKALARAITGAREQPDLFTVDPADDAIPVRLKRIRLERGRTFGDVWLGWTLWRALQLDEVLTRLLPEGREAVPWATMAAVLVLARLCEPSSELHIAETWYRAHGAGGPVRAVAGPGERRSALPRAGSASAAQDGAASSIWSPASGNSSPSTTTCCSTT